MYKILILAYLIGQAPSLTIKTFQMEQTFNTMQECKNELPAGAFALTITKTLQDQYKDLFEDTSLYKSLY